MQEKIFSMLLEENEITWRAIIKDLVKSEQMDPWDVDVSILTQKYIQLLKKLKGMDFRVSGKVVLAAAILLKLQSSRLISQDINHLDSLMATTEEAENGELGGYYEEYSQMPQDYQGLFGKDNRPKLIPRTPQPRKRKVSIYDLVNALEQAIETRRRRVMKSIPEPSMELPKKEIDISLVIKQVYGKIAEYISTNDEKLTFSRLLPKDAAKEDKVYTFIPLLYLTNQRRVDLFQEEHFGEIEIEMLKTKKEINKELGLT